MARNQPGPAPRNTRHRPVCRRRSKDRRGRAPDPSRLERKRARTEPKGDGRLSALAGDIHRYPEGSGEKLREAIGRAHGLDPARIVCGAGSDELIALLLRCYAGPDDEVLYSRHGFLMYPIGALSVGATPVPAPERALTADVDALLEHVTPQTRLVFIANPNNPTGTYLSAEAWLVCMPGCRLRSCWRSMPPMPSSSIATTTKPALGWWTEPTMS